MAGGGGVVQGGGFRARNIASVTDYALWVRLASPAIITTQPSKSAITEILDETFDNVTTSAISSTFDSSSYRDLMVFIEMAKSGTPGILRFFAQFSTDGGTTWCSYAVDQWVDLRYVQSQIPLSEAIPLNYPISDLFRIVVIASATSAINTFDVTLSVQGIS